MTLRIAQVDPVRPCRTAFTHRARHVGQRAGSTPRAGQAAWLCSVLARETVVAD